MSHTQHNASLRLTVLCLALCLVAGLPTSTTLGEAGGRALSRTSEPAALVGPASDAARATPPTLEGLPRRPASAGTGTDFARRTAAMPSRQRQGEATAQILRGNVPEFERHLVPVVLEAALTDGKIHRATIWVTPDYLAIGSNQDFLRMPLTLPSISRICDQIDALPPTTRIVDAVWQTARRHLKPSPMPPGPQMRSTAYFLRHRKAISLQMPPLEDGDLVAGHKKDVVLSTRLARKPGSIAIYGWHRIDGEPIQPLSTVHGAHYADYSHGLRLVAGSVKVDGRERTLREVLADPFLAPILSDEGPISDPDRLLRGRG